MQQKLQTILFFTFIMCVQFSLFNSLKIKSKFMSKKDAPVAAVAQTVPAAADDDAKVHHHNHKFKRQNRTEEIESIGKMNDNDSHRNQYHIHHVVPKNLTNLNNKVRDRFDEAHRQLDQINDLRKENLERELFHDFPRKPIGLTSMGIIDIARGKIDESSRGFRVKSVQEFAQAISAANIQKSRTVTVDGNTFRLVRVRHNFFYGAIVGKGGIGVYKLGNYVLVINHTNDMSMQEFAFIFGQVIDGLRERRPEEKFEFFRKNFEERRDELKKRLKADERIYRREREQ